MDPLVNRKNKLAIKIMVMPEGDDDQNKEKELGEQGMPPALPSVDKPSGMMAQDADTDAPGMDSPQEETAEGEHPDKAQDIAMIQDLLGSMKGRPGGLKDLVSKQAKKKV